MTPHELTAAVRERALELGFDLVGFGGVGRFEEQDLILEHLARGHLAGMSWITPERVVLSCNPEALLPGARSIVALGTAYAQPDEAADGAPLRGRVARYARGRDYHEVIPPKLRELASRIREIAGEETRCRTFVDTGPLVDRAAARRAGLGFVGKNTCILTDRHGSFVFLSAVLTTLELVPDPIVMKDCGSCRACIDACPTGAIISPHEMNATRCISYLTIE
ncbi:MAG: tRNA epoxyqueuosine(34) reductase QueG, partial [Betaproteobacteria bacterium]|nr:tRNA epoxyqueuosine(34) reductase QueG [Betaproteobacteria bacterium]